MFRLLLGIVIGVVLVMPGLRADLFDALESLWHLGIQLWHLVTAFL